MLLPEGAGPTLLFLAGAGLAIFILLVAMGLLIACATNPNFLPGFNPFGGSLPAALDPRN